MSGLTCPTVTTAEVAARQVLRWARVLEADPSGGIEVCVVEHPHGKTYGDILQANPGDEVIGAVFVIRKRELKPWER
jgi:hypothetical protein